VRFAPALASSDDDAAAKLLCLILSHTAEDWKRPPWRRFFIDAIYPIPKGAVFQSLERVGDGVFRENRDSTSKSIARKLPLAK